MLCRYDFLFIKFASVGYVKLLSIQTPFANKESYKCAQLRKRSELNVLVFFQVAVLYLVTFLQLFLGYQPYVPSEYRNDFLTSTSNTRTSTQNLGLLSLVRPHGLPVDSRFCLYSLFHSFCLSRSLFVMSLV